MLLYHTINYSTEYHISFKFISFLPPTFIFISGYLIAKVYPTKYEGIQRSITTRLILRGIKLIALFTLLNLLVVFTVGVNGNSSFAGILNFFLRWTEIYLNGSGRSAIFEVLLPIAYFLLLSPALLAIESRSAAVLIITTVFLAIYCQTSAFLNIGSENLNLLSVGFVGLLFGSLERRSGIQLRNKKVLCATIILFICYYPLGVVRGQIYSVQLLGAFSATFLLLSVSTFVNTGNTFWRTLMKLGEYSLVAYITQIALLQLGLRMFGRPATYSYETLLLLFVVSSLTTAAIIALDRSRCLRIVNRLYKVVFS